MLESPYETIDDSDETPGFIEPAATVDNPYETIDDSDETPEPGTLLRYVPSPIKYLPKIELVWMEGIRAFPLISKAYKYGASFPIPSLSEK